MEKRELIVQGKAKSMYATDDPGYCIMHFRDDTSAFDGEKVPNEDKVFRCEECSYVYTDDPDVDRSRCPQCGRVNETFKF